MAEPIVVQFKFESFTFDVRRNVLLHNDGPEPLKLSAQPIRLLRYILERPGVDITYDDIARLIWPEHPPANLESSIHQIVTKLRAALGAEHAGILQTVSKVGYRFQTVVVPVWGVAAKPELIGGDAPLPPSGEAPTQLEQTEPPVWGPPTTHPAALRASWIAAGLAACLVAVVGLTVIRSSGGDRTAVATAMTMQARPAVLIRPARFVAGDQSPIAIGVAEQLATELQRVPKGFELTVKLEADEAARDPSQRLDHPRYLVAMSVTDEGAARTVLVRLIEAATQRQIWGRPFTSPERSGEALTTLAVSMARQLVLQIRTTETNRPLPPVLAAGHYVMRGRTLFEGERDEATGLDAKALFDQAVALDATNTQALLGYARTRVYLAGRKSASSPEFERLLDEASDAVTQILHINRSAAAAYHVRGSIERMRGHRDAAAAAFGYALSLNPSYVLSYAELGRVRIEQGRIDEGIALIRKAMAVSAGDTIVPQWYFWIATGLAIKGDAAGAREHLTKAMQGNARDTIMRPWLAVVLVELGQTGEARRVIDAHLQRSPNFSVAGWKRGVLQRHARSDRIETFARILTDLGAPGRRRDPE